MQADANQIVITTLNKAKDNPQFSQDLMKYVQYLSLNRCPQDQLVELKIILEIGNMKDLLEFGSKIVPEFENKIIDYVNKY